MVEVRDDDAAPGGTGAPEPKIRRSSIPRWGVLAGLLLTIALGSYRLWIATFAPADSPRVALSVDDAWHARLGLSTSTYTTALTRVGLAFEEVRPGGATPEAILDRSDALLLAGGGDVDPVRYAGEGVRAIAVSPERDAFELALIEGALARDLPILGICRGLQILNVAHGGSLRSIRDDEALGPAHGGEITWNHHHPVTLAEGALFARLEGGTEKTANSYHGQAIDRLGEGLEALARAPDGVIEAIGRPDRAFVFATQWHPEMLSLEREPDLELFRRFAKGARRHALERSKSAPALPGPGPGDE